MTTDMTHTPAEHVAQRIRMYRTRQHMTIDTLARKLHVSPPPFPNMKMRDLHSMFLCYLKLQMRSMYP